jgi:hypothetical protein
VVYVVMQSVVECHDRLVFKQYVVQVFMSAHVSQSDCRHCVMQKGGAMHKVNEEACTLLLGNLIMHVQKSLQQVTVNLSALQSTRQSLQPAVETLYSACSILLSVFQTNSSEVSFWTSLLQPQNSGKGHPGWHQQLIFNKQ